MMYGPSQCPDCGSPMTLDSVDVAEDGATVQTWLCVEGYVDLDCAFYFGEKNGLVPEDPFQTFDDPTGPGAADLDAPHNTTEPDDSAPEVEPPSLVDPDATPGHFLVVAP